MSVSLDTSHPGSRNLLESLIFGFLLLVYVIPLWWFPHFPSQDGPEHLYNAYLLTGWTDPHFPIDRSVFALNRAPVPNWFNTVALAILLKTASPATAEKIFLSLYAIFLPFSMRYAARSFGASSYSLHFLSFGFIYCSFFHLGMINFCLSLAWYLFFIGYWARNRNRFHVRQILVLLILTLLFYFTSGLSYYMALGPVLMLSVAIKLQDIKPGTWRPELRSILVPQAGLLLVIPLTLLYLGLHGRNYYRPPTVSSPGARWRDILWSLSRLPVLTASNDALDLRMSRAFAVVIFISFVTACFYRRKQRRLVWTDALLVTAGMQMILDLLVPTAAAGAGLFRSRLFLFPLLTFVLWLAIQPIGKFAAIVLSSAAVCISITLLALDVGRYVWQTPMVEEYYSTSNHIVRGATILPLTFGKSSYDQKGRDRNLKYNPFIHAAGLLCIEKDLVDLNDYEADNRNYPIVYRSELDPGTIIGPGYDYGFSPIVNIENYPRKTGRPVEYVLLWNMNAEDSRTPAGQLLLQQLSADYELVYTAPHTPLKLYRLRQQAKTARSPTGAVPSPGIS